MTIYATKDSDGGRISENATILAFASEQEARAYLLKGYDAADWDMASAEIGAGCYGDCWVKVHSAPHVDRDELIAGLFDGAPFTADQLAVQAPGQHPGGRAWWIEPTEEVLVVTSIAAVVDYDSRDTIVTNAWEIWTKNGLKLDAEEREETGKTVKDAVNNTYVDGISDSDWLANTLKRLGH